MHHVHSSISSTNELRRAQIIKSVLGGTNPIHNSGLRRALTRAGGQFGDVAFGLVRRFAQLAETQFYCFTKM